MSLSAVITADIVNSTKLSKQDLKKIMKHLETIFTGHRMEFFRGDSFQVYIKKPEEALKLILLARTGTIRLTEGICDIRISLGIDLVKLPIKQLSTASGEAFVLSGRVFDSMKPERRLYISANEKQELLNTAFRLLAQFMDFLFMHITAKQSAVVFELLLNRSQMETAKRLKKSQATIHKHIQSAGWPQIEVLLGEYNSMVSSIKP